MEGILMMDYHLIFIIFSLLLFILSVITLFSEKHNKQEVIIPIAFISINIVLCVICMLGFLSIDLVGFDPTTGAVSLTESTDMWVYYIVFYALLWINTFMLFYGVMNYVWIRAKEAVSD